MKLLASAAVTVAVVASLMSGATPSTAAAVRLPPVNGKFDIQLGGSYPPAKSVKIVDRDRTSDPARGRYNLCYVNAFQTQASERAFWLRKAHADLILRDQAGHLVGDPGWPGEYVLDTRTRAKRARIAAIVNRWIDGCAARGYQAVDPDNLDTWTRFEQLTRKGNLALAGLIADHAHARGLAIGQKNTAELGARGKREAGFDFAVVESCQVYDECDRYTQVYGSRVLEIEYTDTPRSAFTEACRARGTKASVILRDRDIVPRGEEGYVYRTCP